MRTCPECGLAAAHDALQCIRCGTTFERSVLVDGRYAVESELGRGAMGMVYRARDVLLDRTVALKVISPDNARDSRFVERFRREASALASIVHQNVVHVFTMGVHAGTYFYAMEYVAGRDLAAIIAEHREHGTQVPVYIALTILRQVALGLHAVHAAGIVHRDVKPANIVIEDRSGRPVLLDFGLARPAEDDATKVTVTAGTPPYMAPEQIAPDGPEDELGPRTDVYALGCTAIELLTGQPPFVEVQLFSYFQKHLREPAPKLSSRRPELAPLDAIIAKAVQKRPSARYESAAVFAEALDVAAQRWRSVGTPLPPPLTSPPSEYPAPTSDTRALRVLIVDDEPMFCRIAKRAARRAIRERAIQVVEASSGIRALTACLEAPPDLVVLDYDMPGPNGIATLSELRSLPGAARAAVLVVSSSVTDIERWRFSVLGVKDFLDKPVEFDKLVESIRRLADLADHDTRPVPVILPKFESRLSLEVFRALLAVGWADGRLDPEERDAVFAAAEEARLCDDDMRTLRRMSEARVELADIDVSRLRTFERMYLYAIARWIAVVDGELTDREVAMLHVLAFVLNMNASSQTAIEGIVAEVLSDRAVASDRAAVLSGLRRAIRSRYESET